MSLERVEINLGNVKVEHKYEEIEEKKIELGSAKEEKYSKEYNLYLRSFNIIEGDKQKNEEVLSLKQEELREIPIIFSNERENLKNKYEPQKKEKVENYKKLIDFEKESMSSEIEELNNWYKKQSLFSKIILFFQRYNLAMEREKISREHTIKIKELEESRIVDVKNLQEIYDSELNILNFSENEKINKIKNEIEKLKTKIYSLKEESEKLEINIEFIASNDILIVDDLFNQVNRVCNYEKYPAKKYIADLDKKSTDIIGKYKAKIDLIEHINFKQLKRYIEDRIMFLPDTKEKFIKNELEKTDVLLSNIDNKSLDNQQRVSVITDEENILVVAGAGSGKTLTISAKVKYLVENINILPKDILLITFTKKAAEEMETRIKDKLGIDIKVKTFHALGYELLSYFEDRKADIYPGPENFTKDFREKFETENEEYAKLLFEYLSLYIYPYQDPSNFSSLGDFYKRNKLTGLQGIRDKINSALTKEENKILNSVIQKINHFIESYNDNEKKEILYNSLNVIKKTVKERLKEIEKNQNFENIKILLKEVLTSCTLMEVELEKKFITLEDLQKKLNEVIVNLERNKFSLKREQMKSIEEVVIANFFYIYGIEYEYETEYKYSTVNKNFRQYKPDFYLPEYDIYIEHFGINEKGRCPQYSKIEEIRYLEGIKWKRELHDKHGTHMEETYSFEHKQGRLIEKLKNILKKYNIELKPLSTEEIISKLMILKTDESLSDFYKLLNTFLSLFKASNFGRADLENFKLEAAQKLDDYIKNKHLMFLEIFEKYFNEYQKMLDDKGLIDFSDMINKATDYLENSKLPNGYKFKYIIIDEFQDISVARYNLINAIKKLANSKVMAVGDDWQSIYKFAGSEIAIFTRFKKYFGETEMLKIEKTYRNSQQLIDVAGKFVMQNPEQFKKYLVSDKKLEKAIQLLEYSSFPTNVDEDSNSLVRKVMEILSSLDKKSKKITLLGRNNYDIDIFRESKLFIVSDIDGKTVLYSELYPDLEIDFLSIHKSKGLEADEVIIINNKNSLTGFPNQITDDSVLDYVSVGKEDYPFAEERRLFYVALTRTKNRVYLLYPEDYSIFIQELMNYGSNDIINISMDNVERKIVCPTCQTGYLVERIGANKKTFYSCSNFPQCSFKVENKKYVESKVRCPQCGGVMQLKKGPYGEFYGCTNYPYCKFTYKIEDFENLNK